jgi:hypothetical protein
MKSIITRRILREGIRYQNSVYYHICLRPYEGTQVIVRMQKDGLQVFDVYGKPISKAKEITFSLAAPAGEKNLASVQG